MSKKINDNSIQIDGAKLKDLLEGATGKTLKELSLENGFSDSFLRMVVKSGKATPTAQAVIRLYGIEPSAYEIKPEPVTSETDAKQITFDDLLSAGVRDELKAVIKEALIEVLFNGEFVAVYNPVDSSFKVIARNQLALKPDGVIISKPKKAEDYLRALDPERLKEQTQKEKFEI